MTSRSGGAQRIASLIQQLGDGQFSVREEASRTLLTLPVFPKAELTLATQSSDAEVAIRARTLISRAKQTKTMTVDRVVFAVGRVIRKLKIKGLTEDLLVTIPRLNDRLTIETVTLATIATAELKDRALLQRSMNSANTDVRIASIRSYAAVLKKESCDELAKLITDESLRVRITVARSLANHEDRRSLDALLNLLDADDVYVRVRADQLLRAMTQQNFKFVAYAKPGDRLAAVQKWKSWIAKEGVTAKLIPPLSNRLVFGRTLITDYGSNRVIEVDENGKKVWELSISTPWGCHGLPNGHRVISSYSGKYIVEYDAEGKEVWKKTGLPGNAMGLQRLENGNTLVACSTSNQVVEYGLDGKVVWKATIAGRPVDVSRLENGRTLVALEATGHRKVVEVDLDGKILWEIGNLDKPLSVQRLENGNTLVTLTKNRVAELARDGSTVWERKTPQKATGAFRLIDGRTVIATHSTVKMITEDGTAEWSVTGLKYCYGVDYY